MSLFNKMKAKITLSNWEKLVIEGKKHLSNDHFHQAKASLLSAKELLINKFHRNCEEYVLTLLILTEVLTDLEELKDAEEISLEAEELCQNTLFSSPSEKSSLYYSAIAARGALYINMGKLAEAEKLLLQAFDYFSQSKDSDPESMAQLSRNIGVLYEAMGNTHRRRKFVDYSNSLLKDSNSDNMLDDLIFEIKQLEREERYTEAYEKLKQNEVLFQKSPLSFYRITGTDLLIEININLKNYLKAEELLKTHLALGEEYFEDNTQLYLNALNVKAILCLRKHNYDEAVDLLQTIYIAYCNNEGKTSFSSLIVFSNLLSVYDLKQDKLNSENIAKELLKTYQEVLIENRETLSEQHYFYFMSQLSVVERTILHYYFLNSKIKNENLISFFNLKQFINRSNNYKKSNSLFDDDYAKIKSLLSKNQAIVDISRLVHLDENWLYTQKVNYNFVIITSDSIDSIQLTNGIELETIQYIDYLSNIKRKNADPDSYQNYWDFLSPLIKDKTEIFISPEGIFRFINFNSLRNKQGVYIIDQQMIRYVSNYDNLKVKRTTVPIKTATLFADPDFSGAIEEPEKFFGKINQMLPPLPCTLEEARDIRRILENKGWEVNEFIQKEASLENIKKLNSPGILHLATHGFFRPVDVNKIELEESLEYTGLFLADSIFLSQEQQTVLFNIDTVLKASIIKELDLIDTDLVTLSACDTGKGYDLMAGASYGIQRSFLRAGAKNIITTLWKVPDQQSKELMVIFYQNVANGDEYETALRKAQLDIKSKYKFPYYWAAFVLCNNG